MVGGPPGSAGIMTTEDDDDDDAVPPPVPPPRKRRRTPAAQRRKKPADLPRRALSAYNLFFRDERGKIMEEQKISGTCDPESVFGTLGRTVAERWKVLPADRLKHYEALAAEEKELGGATAATVATGGELTRTCATTRVCGARLAQPLRVSICGCAVSASTRSTSTRTRHRTRCPRWSRCATAPATRHTVNPRQSRASITTVGGTAGTASSTGPTASASVCGNRASVVPKPDNTDTDVSGTRQASAS